MLLDSHNVDIAICLMRDRLKLQSDIGQFLTIFGSCLTTHQFVQTKNNCDNKDNIISVIVRPKFHYV